MKAKPSIGVLVSSNKLRALINGQGVPRLAALVRANAAVPAELFFFTMKDINLKEQSIMGHFNTGAKWQQKLFSYPSALYRIYRVPAPWESVYKVLLKQLKKENVLFLNFKHGLDKWRVHSALLKDPEIRQYLPETLYVQSNTQIIEMLQAYPAIYLKSIAGSRGKEVMRIEDRGGGLYKYSYFDNVLFQGRLSLNSLLRKVHDFFDSPWLIAQQAIDLIQLKGCNVDFRAEVQPSLDNSAFVAGIPVRIGRPGSPITTHSSSVSIEQFIKDNTELVSSLTENFQQEAERFVVKIYESITRNFGSKAEIGIDFGVDNSGKFWFIECNAQSARVSFFSSYSQEHVDKAYIKLLEYALQHKKNS